MSSKGTLSKVLAMILCSAIVAMSSSCQPPEPTTTDTDRPSTETEVVSGENTDSVKDAESDVSSDSEEVESKPLQRDPKEPLYPLTLPYIPEELTLDYSSSVNLDAGSVERTGLVDERVSDYPKQYLEGKKFNVYFDNTLGCFAEYIDSAVSADTQYAKDFKEGHCYQSFRQSMNAFGNVFNRDVGAGNFVTYLLSDDEGDYLGWKESGQNIFSRDPSTSNYREDLMLGFEDRKSPMTLWLDQIEPQIANGGDTCFMYISDLHEQFGLLNEVCGSRIKEILDNNDSIDLMILPYKLWYTGNISAYTYDIVGIKEIDPNTGKEKYAATENPYFNKELQRDYYVVALGDSTVLEAFYAKLKTEMPADLQLDHFRYREHYYTETETRSVSSGDNVIDGSTLTDDATRLNFVDLTNEDNTDDDESESKTAAARHITFNTRLDEDELTKYFDADLGGEVFAYLNNPTGASASGGEVSVRFDAPENMDGVYNFDTKRADVYFYYRNRMAPPKSNGYPVWNAWNNAENLTSPPENIKVSYGKDGTVTVNLEKRLSTTNKNIPAAMVVSVPVSIHTQTSTVTRTQIEAKSVLDFVNSRNVEPEASYEDKFTKTWGFDGFISSLFDYKSAGKYEVFTLSEDTDAEPVDTEIDVDRLNVIILAEETSK